MARRASSAGYVPAELDPARRLLLYRATTPKGRRAKAAAVLAMEEAGAFCDSRDDSTAMLLDVVREAAGAARVPLGEDAIRRATLTAADLAPHSDAEPSATPAPAVSNVIPFPARPKPPGNYGTVEQEQAILDQLIEIVAVLEARKATQDTGRTW